MRILFISPGYLLRRWGCLHQLIKKRKRLRLTPSTNSRSGKGQPGARSLRTNYNPDYLPSHNVQQEGQELQ